MKWYFAARTKHRGTISSIVELLKEYNHEVSFDWTKFGPLEPYNKNTEKSKEMAEKISMAIGSTDVFVLISDEGGTDMFVEMGVALASCVKNNRPKVYVVGEHNKRSLMHLHPSITHVDSLKQIFMAECPDIQTERYTGKIEWLRK